MESGRSPDSTLIRQNRYLTPEEQRRYAQERTDTVTISEPENVFQSNTQNEPPAAEPDDFSDIDPIAIREALAERGIVNGKVVDPEKLNRDPFIQRVMADVDKRRKPMCYNRTHKSSKRRLTH